jgi:hypothetical protein
MSGGEQLESKVSVVPATIGIDADVLIAASPGNSEFFVINAAVDVDETTTGGVDSIANTDCCAFTADSRVEAAFTTLTGLVSPTKLPVLEGFLGDDAFMAIAETFVAARVAIAGERLPDVTF